MTRMSEEDYNNYLKRTGKEEISSTKKPKYNNKIVHVDGLCFRSQLEADRYTQLKILKIGHRIAGFILQPQFILQEGNEVLRAITYRADFLILNTDGTYEVEDTKGMETKDWNRTFKMFKLRYPEIKLEIIKKV